MFGVRVRVCGRKERDTSGVRVGGREKKIRQKIREAYAAE